MGKKNSNATHHVGAEQVDKHLDLFDEDFIEGWEGGYCSGKDAVCAALRGTLRVAQHMQSHERKEFIELLTALVDGSPRENTGGGGR
jgi:hypothetical protein